MRAKETKEKSQEEKEINFSSPASFK